MHRCLVIANLTLPGAALARAIRTRLERGPCYFHIVVPLGGRHDLYADVLNALEGETHTEADTRREAETRLEQTLTSIRAAGGEAHGETTDADPLTAVRATLQKHEFDEIVVSTLPEPISHWLRLDLPAKIHHIVDIPVTHVISTTH